MVTKHDIYTPTLLAIKPSTHTPYTHMIFGEENHQTSSLYVKPNTKIIPYKEKPNSAGPTKTRATMGNLDTPTCESLEPT